MHLQDCSSLEELPDALDQLCQLQELELARCSRLWKLPATLGRLTRLHRLCLQQCGALGALPECPTSLRVVDLRDCAALRELPSSFAGMHVLEELRLGGCRIRQLTCLSGLASLKILDICGCNELLLSIADKLPPSLKELWAGRCSSLTAVPASLSEVRPTALQPWRMLRALSMHLTVPPSLCVQGCLEHFDVHDCALLEDVSGLQQLRCLRVVNVSGCGNVKSLGSLTSACLSELYVAGTGVDRTELEAHFQVSANCGRC